MTGIDYNQLSTYLDRLSRLRLIERHVPVTEKPERSKRSQYRLRDPLFRFRFRFLYGSSDHYDQFGDEAYERLVEPELADFVAPAFEQLCCEALWTLYDETPIVDVGQWWYQDNEIDVGSERANVGYEVLEAHYDQRSEITKMEQRRKYLSNI